MDGVRPTLSNNSLHPFVAAIVERERQIDALIKAEIRLRDALRVLAEEPKLKEQSKCVQMALRTLELTRKTLEASAQR